jgi:hypothetical protein
VEDHFESKRVIADPESRHQPETQTHEHAPALLLEVTSMVDVQAHPGYA